MELVNQIIEKSTQLVASGGLLFGFLMVLSEAFLPILPLGVFVSLNINAFGFLIGVVISWIATCLGSYIAFLFFIVFSAKKYPRSGRFSEEHHSGDICLIHFSAKRPHSSRSGLSSE